jgi:hypothetical protein
MINVVMFALTGLLLSMFLSANGHNSLLLQAVLAFVASIPFGIMIFKNGRITK